MNEKILNSLLEARDSVKLVRENLPHTYKEFLSMSRLERDGIYKNIEFATQNILDICAMILRNEDLRVPSSDDDILTQLQNTGIMREEAIEIIRKTEGFRNYFVHRYGSLDNSIAYSDIEEGLADFTAVFDEIEEIVS